MFYISLYYSEIEFLLVIPSFSRTHYCSEFLPWVMTPVNSTSRRASTSNQWLVSSGSAHHAPPYRSSSLSEPCGRHSWSQTDFFHPNLQTDKRDAHSWRVPSWDVNLPACWVVLSEPWSHGETETKTAAGRPPPGETPGPEEDRLRGNVRQTGSGWQMFHERL